MILNCPDVHLICITVCLNLLICELAFMCIINATYLLTYLLTYLGKAFGVVKILHQRYPRVLPSVTFGGLDLSWSDV